jgi:hypothetical protein
LGLQENGNTINRSRFFYEKHRLLALRLGNYINLTIDSAIFGCNRNKQRFIFVGRKNNKKSIKKGELKEKQQRNNTRSTTGED